MHFKENKLCVRVEQVDGQHHMGVHSPARATIIILPNGTVLIHVNEVCIFHLTGPDEFRLEDHSKGVYTTKLI